MLLQGTPVAVTTETLYQLGAVVGATATIVFFLERRFQDTRKLIYRIISAHNKEDDDRFAMLKRDLHLIRVRNAKKDGDDEPELMEFRRRRYLDDEVDHA